MCFGVMTVMNSMGDKANNGEFDQRGFALVVDVDACRENEDESANE